MAGDLFYRLGTLVGTGLGTLESRMTAVDEDPPVSTPEQSSGSNPLETPGETADADRAAPDARDGASEDTDLLVDSVLAAVAAWVVKKVLRPRSVSWPRVVVAGIGATVLADVVGRALGPESGERDRAYDEDADALLVRLAAGIAVAAGYASLLYPRLPGSPLAKGLVFGAMEVAAASHGGLVRVATDTPGLKFPLKDLVVPIDEGAGTVANVAFGIGLGLLYQPPDDE